MSRYIDDIIYYCEPFDRWHAWHDILFLSKYNNGIVKTPERVIASRWQWSVGKVRRYLAELCQNGALEQVKSGRNNILRIASEYLDDQQIDSKAQRLAQWKEQVISFTAGEEQQAVDQYITYWSAYSNITQLYKFESKPDYDIESTWASWMAHRKELQTTKNNFNNGRTKQPAAPSSTKSNGERPFTIEDFITKPATTAAAASGPAKAIG